MRGGAVKWAGLAMAGGAVIFSVVLASRFGTDPGLVESPLLGEPAPVLELPLLDGSGTFDTAGMNGTVSVVNFFASWCPECRNEHTDLVAAADAFADRGVRFVQISYHEGSEASASYLDQAGRSESTEYLHDPGSRAAIAFGVFGVPETFFLDASGTVVGKIIGEADAFILGATLDTILAGDVPGQRITGDTQQRPDG